jgi:CHAD domain-containing protein
VQDHLGELHDTVVAAAWLHDEASFFLPVTAFLVGRLHESAVRRRHVLRSTWRQEWDRLT